MPASMATMFTDLAVHDWPLPYEAQLEARASDVINLAVIHCTELPDLATARAYGERVLYKGSGTGASGHFYIDRNGSVHAWVNPERIAHHTHGHNTRSIGIELVNRGRHPHWLDSRHQVMDEPYPEAQIEALITLLCALQGRYPNLRHIAGHDQLDNTEVPASDDSTILVRRKLDPGPLFPWAQVIEASGLGRIESSSLPRCAKQKHRPHLA